jgi:RNA polymerase sigma factor (sigma-70 family)
MSLAGRSTDAELLAAASDDIAALEVFYRRYVRRVTAFAAQRCGSAEDVADVVAQTFLRLVDAARRYDPALGSPTQFVLGIAANVMREARRQVARDRDLLTKMSGRGLLDADDTERIEAGIDAARAARRIEPALDVVPRGEREMLWRVACGLSPGEAADELGISPGAGRIRLMRARRRVRRHLTSEPTQE